MSDNVWIARLREEYPQFDITDNPKEQYEKIKQGLSNDYYVSYDDFQLGSKNIVPTKPASKISWKVSILGEKLAPGSKVVLALFIPDVPSMNQNVILPALAYQSLSDAKADICAELGQCVTGNKWLEFKPKFKRSGRNVFMQKLVEIYATNKALKVYFDQFVVAGTDTPTPSSGSSDISLEEVTGGLRETSSYTHSLNKVLDIITIETDTLPVGSFKYNVHKYPGDVDIFEEIITCCSIRTAQEKVAEDIQQIVKRIRASTEVYLGDFKAGSDERFAIDIGSWNDSGQLVGYNINAIQRTVNELNVNRLLSQDEYLQFMDAIKPNPSQEQWQGLEDLIKEFTVLRWSSEELSQGFKTLPGAVKLTLADALAMKTLVKIDIWARINGRYIEVTNFFLLAAVNQTGRKTYLTQELPNYEQSIAKDVRFYSSADHRKTLKALKRLWSLALFRNDLPLAARISPLFASNAAALHQIEGEAEVLGMMIVKLPDPPLDQMMEQIDSFKPRIDQLNTLPEYNEQLFALVNGIVLPYYEMGTTSYDKFEDAAEKLGQLEKLINEIVEEIISTEAVEAGLENPAKFI